MDYTSAKQVNPQGGLMVERADGIFFYCAPDDAEHAAIVEHFGDAIEAYDDESLPLEETLENQMRSQRNARLAQLDFVVMNPLRWAEYTAEQQSALAVYRQALLDVPQQPSFPGEIDWPVMPQV